MRLVSENIVIAVFESLQYVLIRKIRIKNCEKNSKEYL